MDFTTIQLEVRERIGELEEDFFTDVEVKRAINEAVKRFSAEAQWPWLYTELEDTIFADEPTYSLPEDVSIGRVFNLSIGGDSMIRPWTLERVEASAGYRLRFNSNTYTGPPTRYYIVAAAQDGDDAMVYQVRFLPTPDVEYDLFAQYMRVPATLTATNDEPDMPEEYQEAVPAWAAGKLFLKEMSISQKASEQFALYGKVLEQAKEDVKSIHRDETVAWGREHPGEQRFAWNYPWRISQTLGP